MRASKWFTWPRHVRRNEEMTQFMSDRKTAALRIAAPGQQNRTGHLELIHNQCGFEGSRVGQCDINDVQLLAQSFDGKIERQVRIEFVDAGGDFSRRSDTVEV